MVNCRTDSVSNREQILAPKLRTTMMRYSRLVLPAFATFAFVMGVSLVIAQAPPAPETLGGTAMMTTTNCSGSTGACQSAPACNNGAGPNPSSIQATVKVCEVSGVLRARGSGTGFRPGGNYISLIYLNGNPSTCSRFPAGVAPTIQNLPQADNDFASMMLGFWNVYADGSATLEVTKQATATGLANYNSMSIREVQAPNVACYNAGLDPAAQLNALRACGPLPMSFEVGNCP